MYRISKVLNHNTIIGIQEGDHQEYLIMGKGIGFGKKVAERINLPDEVSMYSLKETTKRGQKYSTGISGSGESGIAGSRESFWKY